MSHLAPPSYSTFAVRAAGPDSWSVEGDWHYRGARDEYTVPHGFITDGASVPRFFWWLCPPMQPCYLAAAVLHDYLYSTKPVDRKVADLTFYRVMIEDGEQMWRAYVMYRAVRWFGWIAWRRKR